jgi:hypothetical protein
MLAFIGLSFSEPYSFLDENMIIAFFMDEN